LWEEVDEIDIVEVLQCPASRNHYNVAHSREVEREIVFWLPQSKHTSVPSLGEVDWKYKIMYGSGFSWGARG
jgi:hypothetical protein